METLQFINFKITVKSS